MVPKADGPETDKETVSDDNDGKERRFPQHPKVLRAAMEIVKRKKAEAIEKEQYDVAERFKKKQQELEVQLAAAEEHERTNSDASAGSGEVVAKTTGSSTEIASAEDKRVSIKPRSLLTAPNPFRTIELLRQSGYSKFQAYSILGLLYLAVFALEMLLVYAGWQFLGRSGSEDGGYEAPDEDVEF